MAMTEEQGTTLLARVEAGETVRAVLKDLGITQQDFKAWRAENQVALVAAKRASQSAEVQPKARRLADLNRQRVRVQAKLDAIDAEIAEVEAE